MAWYSDEQYEMIRDSKEKKHTAASAHKQRTHCGKGGRVRFPSDNMTKKELNAMNGECKTYRLGSPMDWHEFKSMPEEHQVTYIKLLRKKYEVPDSKLANAMSVEKNVFGRHIRTLGLGQGKGAAAKGRYWDGTEFYKWWNGVDKVVTAKETTEIPAAEEEVDEAVVEQVRSSIGEAIATVHDELYAENTDADTVIEEAAEHMTLEEAVDKESAERIEELRAEATKSVWSPPLIVIHDDPKALSRIPEHICTNEHHYMPVIPKNGTMTFEYNDANDTLATIKALLSNTKVNLTISWECV